MKVTHFSRAGFPLALGGWSTGTVSVNSNFNTTDGGFSALNFVQGITANGSNMLLRPIANIAAGSNIIITIDSGPGGSLPSNTLRIHSTATGSGGSTTITTKDEGTTLSSSVTTLDFVGSGVTASGAGATTTVTIPGGSGALVFLEAHTASNSATLDFTSFISSTYDDYQIEIVGLRPVTDAQDLHMWVGTGGGPTYDTNTTHYSSIAVGYQNNGTAFGPTTQNPGVPILAYKVSNVVDYGGVQQTLMLRLPQSTTQRRNFTGYGQHVFNDAGLGVASLQIITVQYQTLGTALTALQFSFNSGNISDGLVRIYGISKS